MDGRNWGSGAFRASEATKEVAVRRVIVSEYVMLDGVLGEPDRTFPHLAI
jgi:hypothetical protein